MFSSLLQKRYRRCQELFDRWYPNFCNAGQQYQALVASAVGPRTALLDVGCGRTSLAAAPIQTAACAVGVDMSLSDVRQNVTVHYGVLADAGYLPFPSASFDVLVSQWTIEHLADPQRVFQELARVLRPQGRVVLFTTNVRNYVPLLSRPVPDRLQRWLIEVLLRRPVHESHPTLYRANTCAALTRLARQAGLRVDECIYVGNPFYLAFSPLLFRLALLYEKVTDLPALRGWKLYLLATLSRAG